MKPTRSRRARRRSVVRLAKGTNVDDGGADLVYYATASGGAVFSAGSIAWPSAILIDDAVSRITANVLKRFLFIASLSRWKPHANHKLEAIPVRVPLKAGMVTKTAHGDHRTSDYVIVKLHTDEGIVGLGEATVSALWSGETSKSSWRCSRT